MNRFHYKTKIFTDELAQMGTQNNTEGKEDSSPRIDTKQEKMEKNPS